MREQANEPGPGRIGPYPVERRIGFGAMGAVYLARDPQSGSLLAVKTLALGRGSDERQVLAEARQRFEREADAARRLAHPDIVTVFGHGEENGLAWIAMEYLPGNDLARHAAVDTLLPVPALLAIVARIADALAFAHSRGVIHRDVKPANVMIDPAAGGVKVTDFGIAHLADAQRTRTGLLLGTPSFMSPEQITGQRLDGRSDLYALGATLYQLLCGSLPHEAASTAVLMRDIVNAPSPDIRSHCPQLPAPLAELVARMLEKRPDRRPADGQQLARELRQIAASAADASAPNVTFSRGDPRHNPAE